MLFKISSVIRTNNLRYIVLFEADFNFENKTYFGRRLIKRKEILGVQLQRQHGVRPGYTFPEVSVLIRLLFDYVIKTTRKFVIGSYDAENCYDRVAMFLLQSLIRILRFQFQLLLFV